MDKKAIEELLIKRNMEMQRSLELAEIKNHMMSMMKFVRGMDGYDQRTLDAVYDELKKRYALALKNATAHDANVNSLTDDINRMFDNND